MKEVVLITGGAGFIGSNFVHYAHRGGNSKRKINTEAIKKQLSKRHKIMNKLIESSSEKLDK
mgnify:CR=1 FL=1